MDKETLKLLNELEKFNQNNHMFNIPRETGIYLNNLVKQRKPKNILEIGTSNGYSTIYLAESGSKVTTIEIDPNKIKLAKENFNKLNLKSIKILEGSAIEILKNLDESFDFIFIDATKSEYLDYFKLIKFKKPSIIIADNIISHSDKIQNYIDYVRKHFNSQLLKIGSGIEVTEITLNV